MKTKKEVKINLPKLNLDKIQLSIKGVSPLISHKFSQKSMKDILDKQTGKATNGKAPKDVVQLFNDSIYYFPDGKRTGFPAVGFKAAMVRAGKQLGLAMTDTRGMFHVLADPEGDGLVEIKGKPEIRFDNVRLNGGTTDIAVRAEYKEWTANIVLHFNANSITADQLANLLRIAGFSCGIGDYRPEKANSGQYGLFELG